jgi:hypothetical protein
MQIASLRIVSSTLTHRKVPPRTLLTPSDLLLHAILYGTMHFNILHIVAALAPAVTESADEDTTCTRACRKAFPGEEYRRWGRYRTRDE